MSDEVEKIVTPRVDPIKPDRVGTFTPSVDPTISHEPPSTPGAVPDPPANDDD